MKSLLAELNMRYFNSANGYDYYSYSANVGIIIDFKSLKKEKLCETCKLLY